MTEHTKAKDGCTWTWLPRAASHHGTFYRELACGTRVEFGQWERWDKAGTGRFETLGVARSIPEAKLKLEALMLANVKRAEGLRNSRRRAR